MFDAMVRHNNPTYRVFDDHGREIGFVQPVVIGQGGEFWEAHPLDGADFGCHKDRDDAHAAIRLDWSLGRPRNPKSGQRYRPTHAGLDAGISPVFLGH